MADNTTASGGDVIRTFDDGSEKWESCIPAYVTGGSAGAWTVQYVNATHGLPTVIADGGNATLGAKADAKSTATDTTAVSVMSVLKQISASVQAPPSQAAIGDVASGSSDSGNPVKIGAVAHTAAPTAVADGQRANVITDKIGRLVTTAGQVRDLCGDQGPTAFTSTTAAAAIVSAIASTFCDITSITLENKSATATEVILYDDDGTTERWRGYVPAGDMRGIVFSRPLKMPVVNKSWKMKTVTSVDSVYVTVQFDKNI